MFNNKNFVHGKPDITVPAHLNLGKYIFDQIKLKSDEVALENGDTNDKLTYKGLTHYAVNLALLLRKLGAGVGDTVAVGFEKRIEWPATVLGVIFTGATCTSYDVNLGSRFLKHHLSLSKPKYFITSNLFWNAYKDVLESYECIQSVVNIDDNEDSVPFVKSLYATVDNVDLFEPAEVKGQTDVAMIFYSSGTTGMPKGVALTHLNIICSCQIMPVDGITSDLKTVFIDDNWNVAYATYVTFFALVQGIKTVFMAFFPGCIEKNQIDLAILPPSSVEKLCDSKEHELNLDSLKVIQVGGAPLQIKSMEKIKKRLPKLKLIYDLYGLTETAALTAECWGTKGNKPGSIGVVAPGRTLKVVDPKTREVLGPNQQGEICVKSPSLMKGYIGINSFTYLDEDGFFLTGDLGYYDDDDFFFLVDRLKDIILYDGDNIAPTVLETILKQHPGVREAGVVGKPVPYYGELPTAFVVRQPGSEVTEQELIDYVAVEVPPYMQLKGGVSFLEKLPRNARGKLLRKQLSDTLRGS